MGQVTKTIYNCWITSHSWKTLPPHPPHNMPTPLQKRKRKDKKVVSKQNGTSYKKYIQLLDYFSQLKDSPLKKKPKHTTTTTKQHANPPPPPPQKRNANDLLQSKDNHKHFQIISICLDDCSSYSHSQTVFHGHVLLLGFPNCRNEEFAAPNLWSSKSVNWCKVTEQSVTCSGSTVWAWRHCLWDSKRKELSRTHEISQSCTIHQWHKSPQHIVQQQALSRKQPGMYKYWKSCVFCLRLLQVYVQVNSIIAAATINMSVKLECSIGMPVDIKESF